MGLCASRIRQIRMGGSGGWRAQRHTKTRFANAVRLVGMLRAIVQEVWGSAFTKAFLEHQQGKGLSFGEAWKRLATG